MMTIYPSKQSSEVHKEHGGMILGIIVGVLVGLGVALAVAIYVMKVPTPFNNKGTSRSAAQDVQEAKKNKDWDPNAALSGKPAAKPEVTADPTKPAEAKPVDIKQAEVKPADAKPATPAVATPVPPAASPAAAVPTTPKAVPAAGTSTTTSAGDIEYYVQVAAFSSEAEAHAMRGKLALSGFEGKVVEREQSGRTVYRVRVGPYGNQAGSDKAKAGLEAAGFDTVVVRTQR